VTRPLLSVRTSPSRGNLVPENPLPRPGASLSERGIFTYNVRITITRPEIEALRRLTLLFLTATLLSAQTRQVAITIDDLPRGGDRGSHSFADLRALNDKLLAPFRAERIPVIGFVNEGATIEGRTPLPPSDLRKILDLWLDSGADLGNHGYSHADINNVPLADYTADIVKGETVTRAALAARAKQLTYFRHPYLHAGATREAYDGLAQFLRQRQYIPAPVTIDDADYEFASAYLRPALHDRARAEYIPYMESVVRYFEAHSVEVVGHEIPQILLIHVSQLNADLMPDLLAMFKRRGYTFITLAEALKDPAYAQPDNYVGRGGFSWLHRWSLAKGMRNVGEPESPAWVSKAFAERNR
jgi:peptidoglycan-N-acetylglucosamine deacetylase